MIFIVTGHGENSPVSFTGDTAAGALERARWFADHGIRDLLIDADGQEYAPADFKRLFVDTDLDDAPTSRPGLDSEEKEAEPDWAA